MVVCILIGHNSQGTQKQTDELRQILRVMIDKKTRALVCSATHIKRKPCHDRETTNYVDVLILFNENSQNCSMNCEKNLQSYMLHAHKSNKAACNPPSPICQVKVTTVLASSAA